MERELIKIRVLCNYNCQLGYGIIKYVDEVPDEEMVWKNTRRHTQTNLVRLGNPWMIISDNEEPLWSAYVIIDGKSTKEQCLDKANELFNIVKKLMLDKREAFLDRLNKLVFDRQHCSDLFGEGDIFG